MATAGYSQPVCATGQRASDTKTVTNEYAMISRATTGADLTTGSIGTFAPA